MKVKNVQPIFLVGAGPGDPELLTVKAQRLLSEADVVVYDRLVSAEILDLISPGTTRIYVGKAKARHHMPQDEINDLLVRLARAGHRVVRLKGGDPFVFGRGSEEAVRLTEEGIPFEVVPGITAASGISAGLGIPLTHRSLSTSVRFVTGHCRQDVELDLDWQGLADPDTTLVVYMGLANLEQIVGKLLAAGLAPDTPAAAVTRGNMVDQRQCVTTLAHLPATVAEAGYGAPTLIIIGRVVNLAARLNWQGLAYDEANEGGTKDTSSHG
jgi:uroporphyrin-III C-methyltransferase/precorrin-2 dehydrogenase/sirohydrochlorin ferrochelatase/uroporphyrin-III C-methyltransferase